MRNQLAVFTVRSQQTSRQEVLRALVAQLANAAELGARLGMDRDQFWLHCLAAFAAQQALDEADEPVTQVG